MADSEGRRRSVSRVWASSSGRSATHSAIATNERRPGHDRAHHHGQHSRQGMADTASLAGIDDRSQHVTPPDPAVLDRRLACRCRWWGLKDRVEALGGRIALRSPRGAGTAVEIALPLSPTPSGDHPPST